MGFIAKLGSKTYKHVGASKYNYFNDFAFVFDGRAGS